MERSHPSNHSQGYSQPLKHFLQKGITAEYNIFEAALSVFDILSKTNVCSRTEHLECGIKAIPISLAAVPFIIGRTTILLIYDVALTFFNCGKSLGSKKTKEILQAKWYAGKSIKDFASIPSYIFGTSIFIIFSFAGSIFPKIGDWGCSYGKNCTNFAKRMLLGQQLQKIPSPVSKKIISYFHRIGTGAILGSSFSCFHSVHQIPTDRNEAKRLLASLNRAADINNDFLFWFFLRKNVVLDTSIGIVVGIVAEKIFGILSKVVFRNFFKPNVETEFERELKQLSLDLKNATIELRKRTEEILKKNWNTEEASKNAKIIEELSKQISEDEIDSAFVCPITRSVMQYPVKISGHYYELFAIKSWFDRGNRTCLFNSTCTLADPANSLIDLEKQNETIEFLKKKIP